jgi:hypothetical protein
LRDWRTIDELAAMVGTYCWLENRIFEVTGTWATGSGPVDEVDAPFRVWCAATSRHHGALAERWAQRLPVQAGVDSADLVRAPAEPAELAELLDRLEAMKELALGVSLLVETVLPWVGGLYESHLGVASPVREACVMEVLASARREGLAEIEGGRSLLEQLPESGKPSRHLAEAVKRAFSPSRVTPAVRPG